VVGVGGVVAQGVGVGGLNSLAGGLGQRVLNISTGNLGDGVAVLNLNGDNLYLGVVNAVLGGDLTASVLHGGDSGVGNGVSNGKDGSVMGNGDGSSDSVSERSGSITTISVESISIGLSLSFSLVHTVVGMGSIAQHTDDILANLLVLDLLGFYGLSGAHILGKRSAGLGQQDLMLNLAVWGGDSDGSGNSHRGGVDGSYWGSSVETKAEVTGVQQGRVSLGIG